MANPEHIAILQLGPSLWNEWRSAHPEIRPDLSGPGLTVQGFRGANLRDVDLAGADLRWSNLSGTDITDGDLRSADFRLAHIDGALFSGADLRLARFNGARIRVADFSRADLRQADLSGADLIETNLEGANLAKTTMAWTTIANVDLSVAKGLDEVQHEGPSTIGIDSVYKSRGEIPETFLRSAGVPDNFIVFARSLVGQAIEYHSCFISYSTKDSDFAEQLYADLKQKGLRVWYAPEDLKIGDRFHERIEETIFVYDKLMIVLSKASVESRWVEREVNTAREREDRENRTLLFPIRIDPTVMNAPEPWAADIRRTRQIGDFTDWKNHDTYQKSLGRLLRDLKQ